MPDPNDIANLATIGIAASCGALLGLERELAGKPAGMRTHIFVCAGAALMMILGQEIIGHYQEQEQNEVLKADPIRALQAVIVGISFLGAGTIVHQKGVGIEGLTTAASIFLTAGIGVATAVNRVMLALLVTVGGLVVLMVLGSVEKRIEAFRRKRNPGPLDG